MRYIFDHSVFYDSNWLYLIPVIFMVATLVFCIVRVQKMKKELKMLENGLSAKMAQKAVENQEPEMRGIIDEPENKPEN